MRKHSESHSNDNTSYITPARHTLRKKIGKTPLNKIFTATKLQQAQQLIDDAHAEFLSELQTQVIVLGDEFMSAAGDPKQTEAVLKKTADLSFLIKKRMEGIGFLFGFKVAQSLCDYIDKTTHYHPDVLLVVSKHIAVLNNVLKDGIIGDGGPVGRELLANLQKLIRKSES